jgi:hypothetical protein
MMLQRNFFMFQKGTNKSLLTDWHVDTWQQKRITFVKQRIP